jgi:glycosyl transferase family 87
MRDRLPPLWLACFLVTAGVFAVSDVQSLLAWLPRYRSSDFSLYYAAALVGRERGWAHIYDLAAYLPVQARLTGSRTLFLETPPVAWLALPLTYLPYPWATAIWDLAEGAALVLAVGIWTPLRSWWRWPLAGVLGAGFVPAAIALGFGEATLLLALALAGGLALVRRERPVAGGLLLALLCLKPQLGVLLPVALLAAGQLRAGVASIAGMAALASASVVALGPAGVQRYLGEIQYNFANGGSYLHLNTLAGQLGWLPGGAVALLLLAAIVYAGRRGAGQPAQAGAEPAALVAVAASLCITTYVLIYDYAVLLVAGLAALRHPALKRWAPAFAVLYVASNLQNAVWPLPAMLWLELALIGLVVFLLRWRRWPSASSFASRSAAASSSAPAPTGASSPPPLSAPRPPGEPTAGRTST